MTLEIHGDSVVLLSTPTQFPTPSSIPGTTVQRAHCGHDVTVAPSGAKILEDAGDKAVLICIPCALEHPALRDKLEQAPGQTPPRITANQRAELNEALGVGGTDQILAKLGIVQKELTE
jgi:hypothetical protein